MHYPIHSDAGGERTQDKSNSRHWLNHFSTEVHAQLECL